MALSLENSNLVKQKVKLCLSGTNTGKGTYPIADEVFGAFLKYMATQGGNPDLQLVTFSEVQCDDADGTGVVDAACKIYGVYVRKVSAATDNYFKLYDSATVDTTAGEQIIAIPLLHTTQEAMELYPQGVAMANGVTATQHTTSIGVTDGSDGGDGFIIIGAA